VFATVAEGRLWVVHNVSFDETAVTAVDPSTGRALVTMRFGGFVIDALGKPGDPAIGSGAVWAALEGEDHVKRLDAATGKLLDGDGRLHHINIATGAVTARATTELVTRIRLGQEGMWLMTADGKLLRADRRTGRIVAKVPGTFQAADLAVGAEGVWVDDQRLGAVLQIDPGTNRVVRTIPVMSQPLVERYSRVLALGAGAVWVVDKAGEAVVRVDPNR
jgi:outer membrane protein assembly factor BamB